MKGEPVLLGAVAVTALIGAAVVAALGTSAGLVGGLTGVGGAAAGLGWGSVARARRDARVAEDTDSDDVAVTPGSIWAAWRGEGVEHHILVDASARAFFVLIAVVFVVGCAVPFIGTTEATIWIIWGVGWAGFAWSTARASRRVQ